ncbi:hypothetical protein CDL12_00706 [Handroanthus impetiginosus]|uniref:Uncharacterized protein n=1 Tax=Handroanthus impetiginosus TaxID=429701 RepID=A0A2G9I9V8_9LAMI|nr:hypothetical protein CDL12_00706 [Handroanthus impetiginosus]
MAGNVVNMDEESNTLVGQNREEEKTNDECADLGANASLLTGLNLVVLLSFLSLSDEESLNFERSQEIGIGNHHHKTKHGLARSNFQTRRQEVNQFPAVEKKQSSKFPTKIRDCRHSRRL